MKKVALFSIALVFLFLKTSTLQAQPSTEPGEGPTGLLGINVTTELFSGFGPFVILENGQAGNDYFSTFGFNMEFPNSNGMDWILSAYYNDPTFVSTLVNDIFLDIKAGNTWDIGTNLISNVSGTFGGGVSFASLQFENPPIVEGFPGDDPKNPNLTFGGSLDIVVVDGLLSFNGDLNFLINVQGEMKEYHLVTGGKLSPFEGFTIETGFDLNNIPGFFAFQAL